MILLKRSFRRTSQINPWLVALAATTAWAAPGPAPGRASRPAQPGGAQGMCLSDPGGAVVYITPVFDTRLNPKVPIETGSIAREFHEYLKGRYSYDHRGNSPVMCMVGASTAAVEANKARLNAQIPTTGKEVQVDWKYQPDTAWVTASFAFQRTEGGYGSGPATQPTDYGYCISQPADGTVYLSAVFEAKPPQNLALWQIAFNKSLGGKHGDALRCSNGTLDQARRLLKARADGARAADRKVVDTGWKYGDPAAANAPAAKADPDPEPAAPPPPPPPPSAQARTFATNEMSEVMALCNNDRMISGAFDCSLVSRAVYNHRLAHWSADATPEPLAQLFAGDKLDCTTCLKQFASMWAASRAQSAGYPLAPAQCVGNRFADILKAKPYLNRVKEAFDAAMKACPK